MADSWSPATQFFSDLYLDNTGLFDDFYCGEITFVTDDAGDVVVDDDGNVTVDDEAMAETSLANRLCVWFANMGMPIPKLSKVDSADDAEETIF